MLYFSPSLFLLLSLTFSSIPTGGREATMAGVLSQRYPTLSGCGFFIYSKE
ncbi:hypothetical protein GLYMA_06G194850v4 [Glycine max]|nr:hypothetical protein GLYMA_06G194850v4 [Glycine max]KAH1126691.1 hypothetical protein GYH30_015622 [Glycine max]